MTVSISLLYMTLLMVIFLYLTMRTIGVRRKYGIGLGYGRPDGLEGERALFTATRMQGNFVETVPVAVLLFLMLEINGTCPYVLHGLFITLIIGRIFHLFALRNSIMKLRVAGMMLTFIPMIAGMMAAVTNLLGLLSTCPIH